MDTSLSFRPSQSCNVDQSPHKVTEDVDPEYCRAVSAHRDLLALQRTLYNYACDVGDLRGPDGRILDDRVPPWGINPLHIACVAKDRSLLQEALNDARFISGLDDCADKTELSYTARESASQEVFSEIDGSSPLHFALLNGWDEGAIMLIDALEEQQKKLACIVNLAGSSLLSMAAANCGITVIQRLCQHFKTTPDYESYLHHITPDGKGLLHHAVQQEDPAVFEYLRSQLYQISEDAYATGGKKVRSPVNAESRRDINGKTPLDMIREKIGASYVDHLDSDEGFRQKKLYQGDWEGEWENYYVRECHGERISWIPPWEQCCLV